MKQLAFFAPSLPPDVVVACTCCGKPIRAQHYTVGYVESEYRDREGRCFECASPKKKEK